MLTSGATRSTSRRARGGGTISRRALAPIAAGLVIGLVAAGVGGGAALALPTDRAEAEGLLLSGGGAINVDAIAELAGAYSSFPPAEAVDAPLDLTALDLLQLTVGGQVIPGSEVIALGGVGQYANSDVTGAYAASGLITGDGAIQAGTGAPGENTTLTLAPVLEALDLDGIVSDLAVQLGAVAATASSVRTTGGATTSGDYQIASGEVALTAPVLGATLATLDTALGAASADVNALAAVGGPIDTTVDGLLGDIDTILEDVLLGLVDLDDPAVTAALTVDLGAALDTVSDDAFTSGPITLTLSTGEIVIDLDELYDLNGLGANTELLSDGGVNPTIAAALSDILTVQLPTELGDALDDVLNTTELDIDITSGITALFGIPLGELAISVDATLGGLLGVDGSTDPGVSLVGTEILGLEIGEILDPITDLVVDTILPAVGDVVTGAFDLGGLEAGLTDTLTGLVTALDPVLDVVNDVASITVNVQEAGDFRDPLGTDAGAFTQRAATVSVASGLIELNLASATVRAVALAAPAGLAIDPVRGPVTGGTPVTITGTNLADTTGVTFGATPVAEFTVNPDGSITTTAPAQAEPGTVAVTVTNVDGSNSDLAFEYFNVTSVDEITPETGTTLGGDVITITGECFTGATGVTFGGVSGTDFEVVSDTEITVTTPAGAAGAVDVVIVNPTDCGPITVPGGFTYVVPGAPTIDGIVPDRGPETGGTEVTITGEDFSGTTSVTFGGVPADEFTVISDTEIEAVTPPGTTGVVDVIVTNGAGDSAAFDFEYYDVTEIEAVEPDQGPEAGGNTVTITGDCFTGATDVLFGATPATAFTVVSDSVITAIVPAGVGTVDVTVVGAGDCGPGTIDDGYEYVAPPVITDLDPVAGPETGGTTVTITGDGLTDTTGVLFGTTPGTNLVIVDDTEITIETPAGIPGTVPVTVEHPGGDVDAGDFQYLNVPTVTDADPRTGPDDGGTVVTITGEGFTGSTGVTFGGVDGTDFAVVDDTIITVTTPANPVGIVPIVIENPVADAAAGDFEYVAGTEIGTVEPGTGPEDGGNTVVLTGVCFTGATDVTFGGVSATTFTVDSDTQITAVVPAGTGVVDVTVVGSAICGTDTVPDAYEYVPAPVITDLDPTTGPETGGTTVTITGEGLTETTGVLFGTTPGTNLVIVDDTEITIDTPAGAPGTVPVTIEHVGGNVDAGDFEYLDVPSIANLTPAEGPEDGGTVVTVTGEGFTGATGVTFDGVDGTDFEVVSDTEIEVTTPAHAPATVAVVVLHPVRDSDAASFTFIEGTEIDTVTPPGGPEDGGTLVTITGQCFTGAIGVLFGTTPATSFSIDSDTQITAVAPAGTGIVDITVLGTAECGTDTVPGGYEYTEDPVIGALTPATGPETGGTAVTITGSNFDGVTSVTFDGIPGTALTVVSDTELRVTSPANAVGDADVVVTSAEGSSDPAAFRYYAVTVVGDTDPSTGPTGGGTVVTLTGQCFTGATSVLFGGVASTSFRVLSDTTIVAISPAAASSGAVPVTVVGAGTCGSATLPDGFSYVAGAAAGGTLPATGGEATGSGPLAALGLMLLVGGAAVLAIRIRRRTA